MPDKTTPHIQRAARALATADGVSDTFFEQPNTEDCWNTYIANATAVLSTTLEPSEAEIRAGREAYAKSEYMTDDEAIQSVLIAAARVRIGE